MILVINTFSENTNILLTGLVGLLIIRFRRSRPGGSVNMSRGLNQYHGIQNFCTAISRGLREFAGVDYC